MIRKQFLTRSRLVKRIAPVLLAGSAFVLLAANAHAQSSCQPVVGHYVEHAVQEKCLSPIGLCIAGEYTGVIKGSFEGVAMSLNPTAEPPTTTNVFTFTSDSTIHARIGNRTGDLIIKNAGAFRTTGDGDIVDLQVIIGGTGQLANASGVLRASGVFDPAAFSGESEYIGNVCIP